MQTRVPTNASKETDEADGKSKPEVSEATDSSSEDEKSLDEIIDAYAK